MKVTRESKRRPPGSIQCAVESAADKRQDAVAQIHSALRSDQRSHEIRRRESKAFPPRLTSHPTRCVREPTRAKNTRSLATSALAMASAFPEHEYDRSLGAIADLVWRCARFGSNGRWWSYSRSPQPIFRASSSARPSHGGHKIFIAGALRRRHHRILCAWRKSSLALCFVVCRFAVHSPVLSVARSLNGSRQPSAPSINNTPGASR